MSNKRLITTSVIALSTVSILGHYFIGQSGFFNSRNHPDSALLALIKNDQKSFESFIKSGGDLNANLPEIDGKTYTVSEGIAYFERSNFSKYLNQNKISFLVQKNAAAYDIMTISVSKNNSLLSEELAKENPNLEMGYGSKGWTLLHMASAACSYKIIEVISGPKVGWNTKAKDGSTPLTLAAQNDCLPMLSYWKDHGANFRFKDGRGLSALGILQQKKDAALLAFANSFSSRKIASINGSEAAAEINFYNKRKIPKDQVVDHASMVEPSDRPLEATETSEMSEFAD